MAKKEEKEKQLPHPVHDRGYKSLLSLCKIVEQIVKGYVQEEWIDSLDFEHSTQLNTSTISRDLEERESDVLYKIPMNDEKEEIYLYLLVEHQSSIDQVMAFRVLGYLTDIWRHVYNNSDENKRKQKGFKFPPVFPIVLHNGKAPWSALPSMQELVDKIEIFGDSVPNVKYYLIDIPRLDEKKVRKIGNALSTVFLLERNIEFKEVGEVTAILHEALSFLDDETDDKVREAVVDWVKAHLKIKYPKHKDELEKIDLRKYSYEEVKTMIETLPEKLVAYGEEKGGQKRAKEIALKMLKKGKEISEIAEFTSLSKEEIIKLKKEHNL